MNDKLIDRLLYECEDEQELLKGISSISDEETLFRFAEQYNWDSGFKAMYAVLDNKYCTLDIALMLFYNAEGEQLLLNDIAAFEQEQFGFLKMLYERILSGTYSRGKANYNKELSRHDIYILKKAGADPVFYK